MSPWGDFQDDYRPAKPIGSPSVRAIRVETAFSCDPMHSNIGYQMNFYFTSSKGLLLTSSVSARLGKLGYPRYRERTGASSALDVRVA